jgi:hypothetical protein
VQPTRSSHSRSDIWSLNYVSALQNPSGSSPSVFVSSDTYNNRNIQTDTVPKWVCCLVLSSWLARSFRVSILLKYRAVESSPTSLTTPIEAQCLNSVCVGRQSGQCFCTLFLNESISTVEFCKVTEVWTISWWKYVMFIVTYRIYRNVQVHSIL